MANRVLGGAIDAEPAVRHDGVDGGSDDDPSPAPLAAHLCGGGAAAKEATVQVHADDRIERLGSHIGKLLPARHPGIRTEDIEPSEPPRRLRHQAVATVRI